MHQLGWCGGGCVLRRHQPRCNTHSHIHPPTSTPTYAPTAVYGVDYFNRNFPAIQAANASYDKYQSKTFK